jgi:hypothetical protein
MIAGGGKSKIRNSPIGRRHFQLGHYRREGLRVIVPDGGGAEARQSALGAPGIHTIAVRMVSRRIAVRRYCVDSEDSRIVIRPYI